MDKDYDNFVARMGSFGDTLSVEDEELKHYGVLGMKWGRRKASEASSYMKTNNHSQDHKTTSDLRKKGIKGMSNDEMKTALARMQLESQYRDLSAKQVTSGAKYANSFLAYAGTAIAVYNLAKSPAGQAFTKAGMKYVDKVERWTVGL